MAPYDALYGRKCRSPLCWEEVGERKLLGLEIIQMTSEKINLICKRLQTAQSRRKSYYDNSRRKVEFEVGGYGILESHSNEGCDEIWEEGEVKS